MNNRPKAPTLTHTIKTTLSKDDVEYLIEEYQKGRRWKGWDDSITQCVEFLRSEREQASDERETYDYSRRFKVVVS